MLVKEVTYIDYDGNERTEECRFHLTEAETVEMEMSEKGGLTANLKQMIQEKDNPKIMATFKKLLLTAYGVKSTDGRRFIKSKELSEEFSQTEAYNQIFMEIISGGDEAMSAFVNGILPNSRKKACLTTVE